MPQYHNLPLEFPADSDRIPPADVVLVYFPTENDYVAGLINASTATGKPLFMTWISLWFAQVPSLVKIFSKKHYTRPRQIFSGARLRSGIPLQYPLAAYAAGKNRHQCIVYAQYPRKNQNNP
jgi:hypothetical protein